MELEYIRFDATLGFVLLSGTQEGLAKPIDSAKAPSGVILVSATVEGQPATLLLDTGSEWSCLDTEFAKRLRLPIVRLENIQQLYGTGTTDRVRINDLGCDFSHLKGRNLLSTNLSTISSVAGAFVAGILGSDVLREFEVTIDFSSGSAHFASNVTSSSE